MLVSFSPKVTEPRMTLPSLSAPTIFSPGAVFSWGTSDFSVGMPRGAPMHSCSSGRARQRPAPDGVALANHSPFPSRSAIAWALAAGLSGGAALAIFYRALATGRMGLTAPVAAVLGAAIPTAFGMLPRGRRGACRSLVSSWLGPESG